MHLFLIAFLFTLSLGVGTISKTSPASAAMQDRPVVTLQALDKSTARTTTLEAKVGTTIQFGSLFIKIQACRESDPLDEPENAAFLQIWEVPLNAEKSEWVFSGWMFSSSPALSAMDHAVYDVWVLGCKAKKGQKSDTPKTPDRPQKAADQADLEAVKPAPAEAENETEDTPLDSTVDSVIEELQAE